MSHRKFLLFVFIFPVLVNPVFAQQTLPGIYLSAEDFQNNKVSYQKEKGKTFQLRLNELFDSPKLKIVRGKNKITLLKDSVYGYLDKEGSTFRIYRHISYRILNPRAGLQLYSRSALSGYKGGINQLYFFSRSVNGTIYPLNTAYLKEVFSDNKIFCELLDLYFKNEEDLITYDSVSHHYKLEQILQLKSPLISSP